MNVGDKVRFLPGPTYPDELERQIIAGHGFAVTSESDELGIMEVESLESGWIFTIHRDWVTPVALPMPRIVCLCDLSVGGCICGAFAAEMRAKGYTWNPVLKVWEND